MKRNIVSDCCGAKIHYIPPSQNDLECYCSKCLKSCGLVFEDWGEPKYKIGDPLTVESVKYMMTEIIKRS